MANETTVIRKNISPVQNDGADGKPVGDAYGAIAVQDQVARWLVDGRLYWYNRGVITTPVTFTQTTLVYARPSIALRVPTGKSIIPVHLSVVVEVATGTINELVWVAADNDVGAGTSTGPVTTTRGNMRGDIASQPGGCLIYITYSGDVTTAPTNPNEIGRWTQPFIDAAGIPDHRFVLDYKTHSYMPLLRGPATLFLVGAGSAAPQGYVEMVWAEFNSADLGL